MTALSRIAGNCTVYHLALKEMTQNLAKMHFMSHNAVWAVCCFDFFHNYVTVCAIIQGYEMS